MNDIRPTDDPYMIPCRFFADGGLGCLYGEYQQDNRFASILHAADDCNRHGNKYPKTAAIMWNMDTVTEGLTPNDIMWNANTQLGNLRNTVAKEGMLHGVFVIHF